MKRFRWFEALSTVGYVGYLPLAPGTWGSLAAFLAWFLIIPYISQFVFILATVFLFFVGVVSSEKTELALNKSDPGMVVIDEWVGQWIACWFLPRNFLFGLGAFLFFRLFDIWKPWPVRKFDQRSGGWGVMLDDVVAGVMAFLCIQLVFWGLS